MVSQDVPTAEPERYIFKDDGKIPKDDSKASKERDFQAFGTWPSAVRMFLLTVCM